MATFELPEIPEPSVSPNMLVGAASPLWGYFGAAAAGGLAYWWMTRWTSPVNLEALFNLAGAALPEPDVLLAPMEAAIEAAELPSDPVGGESAPMSPFVEAMSAEPEAATAVESPAAPEAASSDAAAKPRLRKAPFTESGGEA